MPLFICPTMGSARAKPSTKALVVLAAIAFIYAQSIHADAGTHDKNRAPSTQLSEPVPQHAASSGSSTDRLHDHEPPHWIDFVPKDTKGTASKSLAEELVEAHERARSSEESGKGETLPARQAPLSTHQRQPNEDVTSHNTQSGVDSSVVGRAAKKSGSAIRKAARSARRSVKTYVKGHDDDDEDDSDDDDEYSDDDDDDYDDYDASSRRVARLRALRRQRQRRAKALQNNTPSRLRSALGYIGTLIWNVFWTTVSMMRWTGRNVVWTPVTYIGAAAQWSAHTSWRTTRWTGQHALIGPVRTVTAPLVYLVDGLLFIFVWLPARALRTIVRELYPVYVFLGAGLAIGTGMGVFAALVIFVGSFIFGDGSKVEDSIARRGAELPRDWERRFLDSKRSERRSKSSTKHSYRPDEATARSAPQSRRRSKGVVEKAMEDSMRREEKTRRFGNPRRGQRLPRPDSDGDDDEGYQQGQVAEGQGDYFFGYNGLHHAAAEQRDAGGKAKVKGKEPLRRSSYGSGAVSTSSSANVQGLSPLGHPLPPGVTAQGGWSSRVDGSSATPASSPPFVRLSSGGSGGGTPVTPAAALPVLTPTSGGMENASRSNSLRQRRSVVV